MDCDNDKNIGGLCGLNRMSACECNVCAYPKRVTHHTYTEWNTDLVLVCWIYWDFVVVVVWLLGWFCFVFHLSNH